MSVQSQYPIPSQLIWASLHLLSVRHLCRPLPRSLHVPLLLRMPIPVLAYVLVDNLVAPLIDPTLSRLYHPHRVSSGGQHLSHLALKKFPQQRQALLEVIVAAVLLDNHFLLISLKEIRDTVPAQFHVLQPRQPHHHQTTLSIPPLVSVSASECMWCLLWRSVGFLKFLLRAPANDFSRPDSPTKSHDFERVHSPGLGKYLYLSVPYIT